MSQGLFLKKRNFFCRFELLVAYIIYVYSIQYTVSRIVVYRYSRIYVIVIYPIFSEFYSIQCIFINT